MAENTRMKELQTKVKHNVEDLHRLSLTVEKLEAALAACHNRDHDGAITNLLIFMGKL